MAFGTARRLGYGGLVIGFLMCLVGAIAPVWLREDVYPAKLETGLWWYCSNLYRLTCDYVDYAHEYAAKVWIFRIASIFSFIISVSSVVVALSRSRGNVGGKTVGVGVTIFIAGAAGIVTITVFDAFVKESNVLSSQNVHYGWAFYVYIVGTSFHVVSSLIFCFAPPDSTGYEVFTGAQIGTALISTSAHQQYGTPQYPNQAYSWQHQPQNTNYHNSGQQHVERKQAY